MEDTRYKKVSSNLGGEPEEKECLNSTKHILDGVFTFKEIILGGLVISFGMTWGGACLFFGWQCGRLVYYAVRSLVTLVT